MKSTATIYNHKLVENGLYDHWLSIKLFEPIAKNQKTKNFSIILPPPNRTGQLHLGHAWDGALQDLVIRYKKLCGFRTIWIPGTDHAGIATQTKYEQVLKQQGVDPKSLTKDVLYKQIFAWADKQANYIHEQWKTMGFALAYDYETYTLDKNVAELVNQSFALLYEKGLIYKQKKLVNWDIILKTPISDIEVINKPTNSKLYYVKYLIVDSNTPLIVATTRPETMFGDIALFVHPNDKRYKQYIGQYVINPVNNKKIPIMADDYIDMQFGTGVMKCTPAHDFHDYDLAKKHNITNYESIMNENGTLNNNVSASFVGLDRLVARPEVVNYLQQKQAIDKIIDHPNEIGYSERTNVVVEPLLSEQWFVKMKPIVADCKKILAKDPCLFLPARFTKTLNQWFNNIEDWCISRQLIWGHQLPVWYKKSTNEMIVGKQPKDIENYYQENLVFDTWYSSGLWPLATTVNSKNPKAKDFYPISLLVTGYDILFFWVARMLFQCVNLSHKTPIKKVYFHGLIRDEQNRKMSKSLGNGINPIDVIDKYGTDTLRTFLVSSSTIGDDLRFDNDRLKYLWGFFNKLWNAHNYISQFSCAKTKITNIINKWIINEFNVCLKQVTKHMDNYNFVLANKLLVDFVWETFCNKYLEMAKPFLNNSHSKNEFIYTLNEIFKQSLIMIHPFAPFITERIYQNLYHTKKSILLESWPKRISNTFKQQHNMISAIWSTIKDLRIKHGIKNSVVVNVSILSKHSIPFTTLTSILGQYSINLVKKPEHSWQAATIDAFAFKYQLPTTTNNNLQQQKAKLEFEIERSKKILSNSQFLANAPKEKVNQEKQKLAQYIEQYEKLTNK